MAQTIAQAASPSAKAWDSRFRFRCSTAAGLPLVMLRGDGAGLHTLESADRKAYTARTFSQPSADFVKRLTESLPSPVGSRNIRG